MNTFWKPDGEWSWLFREDKASQCALPSPEYLVHISHISQPGVSRLLFVLCSGLCFYSFVYMMIVPLQASLACDSLSLECLSLLLCLFFSTISCKALLYLQISLIPQINSPWDLKVPWASQLYIFTVFLFFYCYTHKHRYTQIQWDMNSMEISTSSCSSLYFQNLVPRMFQCIFPLFMMANLGSQLDTLSRRGIAASGLDYEQVCVGILLTADWYRKAQPTRGSTILRPVCLSYKKGRWANQVKQVSNPNSSPVSASVFVSKFLPWALVLTSFDGSL